MAKTHQHFASCFKDSLNKYNLTPPQFATLAFLWKNDGLSQIQLGNLMNKDRTTISGIIDRLEKEGLVRRRSDPEDRRTHLIYLTAGGAGLRGELESLATRVNKVVTAMLTGEEKKQLEIILKKILAGSKCDQQ